mmetsp:Transcript_4578/g.13362  ORF Transcript_4578/g.13362 Transcript_4578/m.13362 type:complete len:225 (+) Transcript_4578:237-911(+)
MPMIRRPWRHFDTRHSESISPPPVGSRKATVTFGVGSPKDWLSATRAASINRSRCSSLMQRSMILRLSELSPKYVAMTLLDAVSSNSCHMPSTASVTSWEESTSWTVPLILAKERTTRETMIAENVTLLATTSKTEKLSTCSSQAPMTPYHLNSTAAGKPHQTTSIVIRRRPPTISMSFCRGSLKARQKDSRKYQMPAPKQNHLSWSFTKYMRMPKTWVSTVLR